MERLNGLRERREDADFVLLHCNSAYPAPLKDINLNYLDRLREIGDCVVGYSGHEVGLQTTLAAAVLGAAIIERHITLDRTMWGSDQAASVEPAASTDSKGSGEILVVLSLGRVPYKIPERMEIGAAVGIAGW